METAHTLCLTRLIVPSRQPSQHAPFPHSCRLSVTSLFRRSSNSSFCRGAYIGALKCIARQRRVGQCSRAPLLKASGPTRKTTAHRVRSHQRRYVDGSCIRTRRQAAAAVAAPRDTPLNSLPVCANSRRQWPTDPPRPWPTLAQNT